MWTTCDCDLRRPEFRRWLDHLYFHGRDALARLAHELEYMHLTGFEHTGGSLSFLTTLTNRLERHSDHRDLLNVLAVIAADMICEAAGNDEVVASRYDALWGPVGSTLVACCLARRSSGANAPRPENAVTANELVRFVSIHAPQRMSATIARAHLPESLELLEHAKSKIRERNPAVKVFVGVQHLFGSTIPLINALSQGIDPSSVLLLGKPYSTNHATMWSLRNSRGYYVHPGSSDYDGTTEYHIEADRHVESILDLAARRLTASGSDSLALLLDDGGRAIRLLHSPRFGDVRHRFRCVEQTRRGIRELDGLQPQMPVVNVAESRAKLVFESPLIADSVVGELSKCLQGLVKAGVPVQRNALVIGYGAIGKAVARRLLLADWQVAIYDADQERAEAAARDGMRVHDSLRVALQNHSEIIGCTGTSSVQPDDYQHIRHHTVLVSASSSDVEFSAWRFRSLASSFAPDTRIIDDYNLVHERFDDRLLLLGDTNHPCHFLYVLRLFGKRIFLVNGGFPVNMTGDVDPIPARSIQLTRTLLYAGGVQASHTTRPGIIDLDESSQDEVIGKWKELRPAAENN